ncbi:hypothetical protein OH77DRAFT_678158 [Trametes cingulata]|nr:hypothetical protein OH77DRAFT_678158 [Trametes cingulata]
MIWCSFFLPALSQCLLATLTVYFSSLAYTYGAVTASLAMSRRLRNPSADHGPRHALVECSYITVVGVARARTERLASRIISCDAATGIGR